MTRGGGRAEGGRGRGREEVRRKKNKNRVFARRQRDIDQRTIKRMIIHAAMPGNRAAEITQSIHSRPATDEINVAKHSIAGSITE